MIGSLRAHMNRLRSDESASPSVEFAFAAPILALMIVGTVEFGMIMFTTTLMESGLRDAARFGITGQVPDGQTRLEHIIEVIGERTLGLVNMDSADIQVRVYPAFNDIGRGEAYVDGDANGKYDAGETFTDENGNGAWDADIGAAGAGESGDIVVYRMTYAWPLLTPLAARVIGAEGAFSLRAAVAVRNEPWETGPGG